MRQIVAEVGIHAIVFTRTYRPMGHGKIEALNRLIRSAFIAEVTASDIRTLDALNEAFVAWADLEYSRTVHGETGEAPRDRWRAGIANVRYVEEEKIRRAFQWVETRTSDKAGVFSLFGCEYQVGPTLARKRVQVRFDPEQLDVLEIWHDGRFAERVKPFAVQTHRRPRPVDEEDLADAAPAAKPVVDWLGYLRAQRRSEAFGERTPRELAEETAARRVAADEAIVSLLAERLDATVRDDAEARAFLGRYGPFDPAAAAAALDRLVAREGRDQHVSRYLEAIRRELGGAA